MYTANIRKLSSIEYIQGLDGVRAFAVILVILHHYLLPFSDYLADNLLGKLLLIFAKIGWVGVDIFFVISGYLITQVLIKRPVKSLKDYRSFILSRAWRLLPAYLSCLIIFSCVAFELNPNSKVLNHSLSLWTLTSNIQSAFFSRTALLDQQFNLLHFWSLALEWHFYLSVPILLQLFRSYWIVAFILLIVAVITRILFQKLELSDNAIYAFTFCRWDAFAIGIMLAAATTSSGMNNKDNILMSHFGKLGLVIFCACMMTIVLDPIPFKKIVWLQSYGYTIIAISVAMMLNAIISNQNKFCVRLLEHPIMTAVGRRSYSLYIWHLVFFPAVTQFVISLKLQVTESLLLILGLAFLFSVIATYLSYRFIEIKCYQFYKNHFNKHF